MPTNPFTPLTRRLRVVSANLIWYAYSTVRARRWRRATRDVAGTQAAVLRRILSANAETDFGREHGFASIATPAEYQRAVPTATYEDMQPYIERAAEDEHGRVLTAQPISHFALTSGSTHAAKLIPYTSALVSEFQEGIDPWVHYLIRQHPRMLYGKTYWSVTPVGTQQQRTIGDIPIGFEDEQQYFSPLTRWVLNSIMVGTSDLAGIDDMEVFRYSTLRLLLQERYLSWVSIWNPSFFTLLLEPLTEWLPRLIADIRQGTLDVAPQIAAPLRERIAQQCARSPKRARELERLAARWLGRDATEKDDRGHTLYEAIWPDLRLISCWAHGNAALAIPPLRACLPWAAIEPKGLLATEAFVSFPFTGDLSALSLLSHYFEFEEADGANDQGTTPAIRLAHELVAGRQYGVIVTTGGGLYRYQLNDVVEVVGYYRQCPLMRFVGRQSKVVDVAGEKLHEDFVQSTIIDALVQRGLSPSFWMVAPERPPASAPFYALFVQLEGTTSPTEESLCLVAADADQALRANYHYDYCRRLGQLGELRLFVIAPESNGYHTYLTVCTDLGQRLGDIKPTALHAYQRWSAHFTGGFVG